MRPPARAPLLVAHRGGNDLLALRHAEGYGADLVEADVQLCSTGRVDVRHARRLGRLPVLCDDWRLSRPRAHLTLEGLLAAAAPSTALLLDLKGRDARLAERVAGLVEPELGRRAVWICARRWHLLEPFAGERRLRLLPSVGTTGELAGFLRRFRQADGVSIRESLVTGPVVRRLREHVPLVVSWTVNEPRRAAELRRFGVGALTTDDLAAVGAAVSPAVPVAA